MPIVPYIPRNRVSNEKIVLRNGQFARWLSKRTGVSQKALAKAMELITNGIVEALADGYSVNFNRLGVFEAREMKPRLRYHYKEGTTYMSEPATVVHFRKSELLTSRVRELAASNLDNISTTPTVKPVGK